MLGTWPRMWLEARFFSPAEAAPNLHFGISQQHRFYGVTPSSRTLQAFAAFKARLNGFLDAPREVPEGVSKETRLPLSDRLTDLAGHPAMRFAGERSIGTAVATIGLAVPGAAPGSAVLVSGAGGDLRRNQNASVVAPPRRPWRGF